MASYILDNQQSIASDAIKRKTLTRDGTKTENIEVQETLALAIVEPAGVPIYKPTKDEVILVGDGDFDAITDVLELLLPPYATDKLLALDLETTGLNALKPGAKIAGVGIASHYATVYFHTINWDEESDPRWIELFHFLSRPDLEFIGHNAGFDMGWLVVKMGGFHINWKYDTLALYRQLASEGYMAQLSAYKLKVAQIDLLGWDTAGDEELDQWLALNGYHKGVVKEGTTQAELLERFHKGTLRAKKSAMSNAPSEILGYYCALDAYSTRALYTEIFKPSVDKYEWAGTFWDYHALFMRNLVALVEQYLNGIKMDKKRLSTHLTNISALAQEAKQTFMTHPDIAPHIARYRKERIEQKLKEEPAQFLAPPKLGTEPVKYTKKKTISKTWESWDAKRRAIESGELDKPNPSWFDWDRKLKELQEDELFNIDSPAMKQWLFFGQLKLTASVISEKSGKPSVSKAAIKSLGIYGEMLQNYNVLHKEAQMTKATLAVVSAENRIHPQFKAPGTFTGRLAGGSTEVDEDSKLKFNIQQIPKRREYLSCYIPDPGYVFVDCFAEGTDILTPRGWVDILQLTDSDEVWQVNKDTLQGSFVKPSRLINQAYSGDMYRVGNRRANLLVTPNHKMLYVGQQSIERKKNRRQVQTARESISEGLGLAVTSFSTTETNFSDKDIWMSCMLQADGHKGTRSDGTGYTIEVAKPRKRWMITELLGRPGHISKRDDQRLESERWSGVQFETPFFNNKKFKLLGVLGSNQAETFVEALSFWDGNIDRNGRTRFSTTQRETADEVQAYLVSSGYEAKITVTSDRKPEYSHWKDLYTVHIGKRIDVRLRPQDIQVEPYEGRVGCVTVPEGFVLVRYEGTPVISGQCDHMALEPVVLTALSRDPAMMKLYGPNAKKGQDIYLFVGANLPKIGKAIRATGYDPEFPTLESLAIAKKECKKERAIAKTIVLGATYGMGPKKLRQTLFQQGINMYEKEAYEIHDAYWSLFKGVKKYQTIIEGVYHKNGGWVLNAVGRPVCCDARQLKDLQNRVVQSSGHDIHMMFIDELLNLRNEVDFPVMGAIWDFHDQSIVQVPIDRAQDMVQLYYEAYKRMNAKIKKLNPDFILDIKGEPAIVPTFAEAKVQD